MEFRGDIIKQFALFAGGTGGIDNWLTEKSPSEVLEALQNINSLPLSRSRLNQLLTLSHEAPISEAFFRYYWLTAPDHPYNVMNIPGFRSDWVNVSHISSLDQLYWGLYRFYVDALLFFGNVRTAYQTLRSKSEQDLSLFFKLGMFDPDSLTARGPALELEPIAKDNRYLISEMACKSYDAPAGSESELKSALMSAYQEHVKLGSGMVKIGQLMDGSYVKLKYADRHQQLMFAAEDLLDEQVRNEEELTEKISGVADRFAKARMAALTNTQRYLSMVGDLDVYVATSMRSRADFRAMANFCEEVFSDTRLRKLNIRYFDPTLSACANHEDKGLIECLMVKCAKALVYCAGSRDSYGKDAEAAMALSLGKPVVFYCDDPERAQFYKETHPLSRLIDFQTGVAVGAMITDSLPMVPDLVARIFENNIEYQLSQKRPGYLCLSEKLTGCVVRLQTNDNLLRETFWNYYHSLGKVEARST